MERSKNDGVGGQAGAAGTLGGFAKSSNYQVQQLGSEKPIKAFPRDKGKIPIYDYKHGCLC